MNPYQAIHFEELAREAVELVHGQIQSKGIQVSIQENLPIIYGDRQRLIEVVQNLIDNAAKFTRSQATPRIEIGQNGYEDGKPIFYVKDNGIGIDLIHHDRIFGLFNKLDANSEGTGIGLALVKRIVEVHGGRIWVQSEAQNGATFFFTLPAEPAA
jgi:signal transduction histidine kinase